MGRYFLLMIPTNIENDINIGVNKTAIPLFTLFLISPLGFNENIKETSSGKEENNNTFNIIVKNNIKMEYLINFCLSIFKHLTFLHD